MSPAFDHRDAGTTAEEWEPLVRALPAGDGAGGHDHLLVLAAHPDDETLGAGGLIADAAAAGAQITVVVATDGEASHPDSPTHTRARLARRRRAEVREALQVMAPDAELVLLGLPDGGLAGRVEQLRAALPAGTSDATVVAAPWRHDGHPDHEACGAVAALLCAATGARLLEYPVWGWHWGVPGESGPLDGPGWFTRRMTPAAHRAKAAALAAHVSQHRPLSEAPGDEPVLGEQLLAQFTGGVEVFRAQAPRDLPRRYFDRLYDRAPDPWQLGSGFYEQRKRELLLAALPRPRFRRAFEPGCATGLLTERLAGRCDQLLAQDISPAAVAATAERLAGHANVHVTAGAVPQDWPDGEFDLIVLGEVGYYLADPELLARRVLRCLAADGVLAAVHWRHPAAGYPSSAGEVHAAFGRGLLPVATHVEQDFLLDVWSRDGVSVARAHGLLP